jgi:rhodanese-related sulfurtransferase
MKFFVSSGLAADFPLRAKYPQLIPISTADLLAGYDSTIVVDVRSKMEFDVAHISKAKHISVSKKSFLSDLEKVRSKGGAEIIAFYCNGTTCAKSYKAADSATQSGFKNVRVYDAGIFSWITENPEKGTLLGKSPADPSKLISKADLKKKMLDYNAFKAKAEAGNAVVVDVRDPLQRAKASELPQNKAVKLKGVREIPMDRMVKLIEKKQFQNKTLFVLDAVANQRSQLLRRGFRAEQVPCVPLFG